MVTKMSVLKTNFSGIDFSKYESKVSEFVNELSSRANKKGHFLNWVNLPQEQLKRLDSYTKFCSISLFLKVFSHFIQRI